MGLQVSNCSDVIYHNGIAFLACVYGSMSIDMAVTQFVAKRKQRKQFIDDHIVKEKYLSGKTIRQIALELGCSRGCIHWHITKMKIARKRGGKYGVQMPVVR